MHIFSWLIRNRWSGRITANALVWSSGEGFEEAAAHDQEPGIGLPEPQEEEGVPAEPGDAAAGGAAGERASAEGEPSSAAASQRERGQARVLHSNASRSQVFFNAVSNCVVCQTGRRVRQQQGSAVCDGSVPLHHLWPRQVNQHALQTSGV